MTATDLSVHSAAREAPDKVALIADGECLAFSSLSERVQRAEAELRALGVTAGQLRPVALIAAGTVDTVVFLLALMNLGVPCALIDSRLGEEAQRERMQLSDVDLALGANGSQLVGVPRPRSHGPNPTLPVTPESLLAIVFTSGSSGAPKGVKLSRRAFVASAAASAKRLGWEPHDRWYTCLPLSHVGGISILVRCLLARTGFVLHPGSGGDAQALADGIEQGAATLISVVPTQLRRMLEANRDATWRRLRFILVGGAATSGALLAECRKRGIRVVASYGLTECCSQVATQNPLDALVPGAPQHGAPPLDGVGIRINGGVVEVSGDTLFSGYLPPYDRDDTIQDGWFATTDVGTLENGILRIDGRRTELIVTGGENVYPAEVEVFLESLDIISEACVFSLPDPEWGEIVCAAVVKTENTSDASRLLLAECVRAGLAPHQRPRQVAWLPSLPLNQTGKLDRPAVRKLAEGALRPLPAR